MRTSLHKRRGGKNEQPLPRGSPVSSSSATSGAAGEDDIVDVKDVEKVDAMAMTKSNGVVVDVDDSGDCTSGAEDTKGSHEKSENGGESPWRMGAQALPSTLVAGLGMVAAGIVLSIVQQWEVFISVTELFVLIPALLGLKGNLEMTLASRLSTQANLGAMNTARDIWRICFANLALVQVQSAVVGVLASCIAALLSMINKSADSLHIPTMVLFTSASATSFLTALLLGGLTCLLVVACHRFGIDPDNVAAPLSASLGDVTTMAILAGTAQFLYELAKQGPTMIAVIMVVTAIPIPICVWFSWRSEHTRDVLVTGWAPVIVGMAISSSGGFVLDKAVAMYQDMSTFTPLVNGIGGNLAAIHASRLSTFLHKQTQLLSLLPTTKEKKIDDDSSDSANSSPPAPLLSQSASMQYSEMSMRSLKVLVLLLPIAHTVFFAVIGLLKPYLAHSSAIPIPFFFFVFFASLLQVLVLLLTSHRLVVFQWRRGRDPDSCTIPYLTALGDLVGTGLLALAFFVFTELLPGFSPAPAGLPTVNVTFPG